MRWSDLIGTTVDRYRINKEIGWGGTAHVFSAYDNELKQEIALKALLIQTDDRVAFMQRFLREVDAISTLDHPNIVKVYGAGQKDEFVYIALQLIEGDTLSKRIGTRSLSTQAACQYIIQIARALHEAHSKGIIHRDVKPSNILLDKHHPGKALLTDFGTAKIENATGLTKTGSAVGTPEYMSPEQAEGRPVDQRSDIYSLGCTLYEALASRPPFVGANAVSILYQHVHMQPTYIRSFNTQTPRELWQVLHTCLAKRPEERYGSAARLAEELQPFADGLIQPTPAPWSTYATGRPSVAAAGESGVAPAQRPLRPEPPKPIAAPSGSAFTLDPYNNNDMLTWNEAQRADGVLPLPTQLETGRAPNSQPANGPGGGMSRLRATNGGSGLLSGRLGLTPEAKQALAAWEEQLQQSGQEQIDQRPTEKSLTAGPSVDDLATAPTPTLYAPPQERAPVSGGGRAPNSDMLVPPMQRAATSRPRYGPTSGPIAGGAYQTPNSTPIGYRSRVSVPNTPQRAPTSGPRLAQMSQPMHPPIAAAPITFADLERRRPPRQRRMPTLLVATLGAAVLAGGLMFGMSSLKLFANQATTSHSTRAHPTATVKPAKPTVAPTVTHTPPATATPNPQAQLDRQAADAFRSITVGSFSDGSCSGKSATTQFPGGSPVYINFCMANSSAPGPVTAVVRQNGATVRTLISSQYTHPGSFYSAGHTLSSGSYDMVVTVNINGDQATAADIPFTVG